MRGSGQRKRRARRAPMIVRVWKTKAAGQDLTDVKIPSLARRVNAITPQTPYKRNHRAPEPDKPATTPATPLRIGRRGCESTARVAMPEMETQREWTRLQLLENPLGSVPETVTSATRRPRTRQSCSPQRSRPCRWRSFSRSSPICLTRTSALSGACPRSSGDSPATPFYGELTR